MDLQLKSASFGGYDKKSVENYIEELVAEHEDEVAQLKNNVVKLSETVKNLHTMREVNLQESSNIIDDLKNQQAALEAENKKLLAELEEYRSKEDESKSRYESISKTLLSARENADALMAETEKTCKEKMDKVNSDCDRLTEETTVACDKLRNDTMEECETLEAETKTYCDKLKAETESACQELRETTFADCEALKRSAKDDADKLKEETLAECNEEKNQARFDAQNIRASIKKECESVSGYMSMLLQSVDSVAKACENTKAIAEQAFPDIAN